MTAIAFHFNVPAKVGYACRLLRKAAAGGAKVVVAGDAALLRELDAELWTFSAVDFIAHCHVDQGRAMVERSPVVLAGSAAAAPHREVLVNLGDTLPDGFERFQRVIEIVSADEADRQRGRSRWKQYAERGYTMDRHDAGEAAAR